MKWLTPHLRPQFRIQHSRQKRLHETFDGELTEEDKPSNGPAWSRAAPTEGREFHQRNPCSYPRRLDCRRIQYVLRDFECTSSCFKSPPRTLIRSFSGGVR